MLKYRDLDLSGACEKGFILAVYRRSVEFGLWDRAADRFSWETGGCDEEHFGELLELHIFDENSEYRAISSVRGENGYITAMITDGSVGHSFFIDCNMLMYGEEFISSDNRSCCVSENSRVKKFWLPLSREQFNKGLYLKVRDYYNFDDNDLLYLNGYRLIGFGERKDGSK